MKHQLRVMVDPPSLFPQDLEPHPSWRMAERKNVYFVCNNCNQYLQVEKATLAEWLLGADILGEELSDTFKKWLKCPDNWPNRLEGLDYTGRRIDAPTVGDSRGVPLLRSV